MSLPLVASVLGLEPSFGFGDRLGLATPGHLQALLSAGGDIRPIFAQQSIREMRRTGRSADEVMQDAQQAAAKAGYAGICGADADHLKTFADVDETAAAGFVFFTIDPSAHVDQNAESYSGDDLESRYLAIREQAPWAETTFGKKIDIAGGPTLRFDELSVKRAAIKYGPAINHTIEMANYIDQVMAARGTAYEIELSVDETEHPTTLIEHYLIAEQCLATNMKLVSLAPRFIGDFEKGIDFRGDLRKLEASLKDHAAVAKQLGPYKLSLHSGSDKLSMYEMFARSTGGMFHVKTAGTSYLEAIRVVARHDETLFRQIVEFSRGRFETDRATYHISAELARVAPIADVSSAAELERIYLNEDDGRQVLHVTFGSVLTDATLGPALRSVLVAEPQSHANIVAEHFEKHLQALQRGM